MTVLASAKAPMMVGSGYRAASGCARSMQWDVCFRAWLALPFIGEVAVRERIGPRWVVVMSDGVIPESARVTL